MKTPGQWFTVERLPDTTLGGSYKSLTSLPISSRPITRWMRFESQKEAKKYIEKRKKQKDCLGIQLVVPEEENLLNSEK